MTESGGRRRRESRDTTDWDVYDHPPPIPVADGLKARSRRGAIGESWWSRRFVAALESYYTTTESRLARGRSYARAGQVVTMTLEPGRVSAVVQGSRVKPYEVEIRVRQLREADWARVERAMAARAVFLARLLAGEMPNEIEEAFDAVSVSLFPARRGDLRTRCSCPDTANPCKHVAAAYYLLAESFDADPFRVFEWRGRPRDQLIAELRALRPGAVVAPPAGTGDEGVAAPSGDEATDAARRFWDGRPEWAEVRIDPQPAGAPDALLREMPADVEAVLGPDGAATLRALYLASARAARRRLDPGAPDVVRRVPAERRARGRVRGEQGGDGESRTG